MVRRGSEWQREAGRRKGAWEGAGAEMSEHEGGVHWILKEDIKRSTVI